MRAMVEDEVLHSEPAKVSETRSKQVRATIGRASPLGATIIPCGVNFSLFSRGASLVELLFFDREDDDRPARVISLDPTVNRTYYYWHIFVPGIQVGQLYAYRVLGPFDPGQGMRFDGSKV